MVAPGWVLIGSAILMGTLETSLAPFRSQETVGKVRLLESPHPELATKVDIRLEAKGIIRPDTPQGATASSARVEIRTRVIQVDRSLAASSAGKARSARRILQAEARIDGKEPARSETLALRRQVDLLVVESGEAGVSAVSQSAPLTREELELVQLPADPIELPFLLPAAEVAAGDTWSPPDTAARSLTGYDRITANRLSAKLASLEAGRAKIEISGEVEGEVLGARGRMNVAGTLEFDREAGRISGLELRRSEARVPGPVEPGLEFQSVLRMSREATPIPSELSDGRLPAVATDQPLPASWFDLVYRAPGDRYSVRLDRAWFVVAEDEKQVVLRRFDRGGVVAQCNLIAAPAIAADRKADLPAFRDEVKKAIGDRFERFLDVGQVAGAEPGGTRFRVSVEGKQEATPIVWIYYRLLNARGDQVVATFTLRRDQAEVFGPSDLRLIESLTWGAPSSKPAGG